MSDAPEAPGPVDPADPWAPPPASGPGTPGPPPGAPGHGYGQPPGQPSWPGGQPAHQPSGAYSPYPPGGYPAYPPRPDPMATAAMWSGIGLLVLSCCGVGLLGVVPVVLGAQARGRIRRGGGQLTGDGMAMAGIILGAVAVVVSLVVIGLLVALVLTGQATFDSFDTSGTSPA